MTRYVSYKEGGVKTRPKISHDELVGKKFGKLLVLEYEKAEQKGRHGTYRCLCDCGNVSHPRKNALLTGQSTSCGHCYQKQICPGMRTKMLTVIKKSGRRDENRNILWECRCDCGRTVDIAAHFLRQGRSSCGCTHGVATHNQTNTRLYSIWRGMKRRCYNPNDKSYQKWYGAKGIRMCDEWKNNFMSFHDWSISNGYTEDMTIDRIDSFGNYEPSNCRWVNHQAQAMNKSNNVRLTYNEETLTVADWARKLKVAQSTIKRRFEKYGSPYKEGII